MEALLVCQGPVCRGRLAGYQPACADVALQPTGCQGPCKHAPVATLCVGENRQMFAQLGTPERWSAVLGYGRRALRQHTLLADPGPAVESLFDPDHAERFRSAPMRRLAFLAGRFEGPGRFHDNGETFSKEVAGEWEVGGRFLRLRMLANYGEDTHYAVVMVGEDNARSFTDDGLSRAYELGWEGDTLVFEDTVPHRARGARRACKRITPYPWGYREVLEVDGVPFYTVDMERRAS